MIFSTAVAASRSVPLVWHVEHVDGETLESHGADEPINPASVVKIATTWWALETLGPDRRFDTRVLARGAIDPERRVLEGDLVFEGSGDPDFHVENAFLTAAALNDVSVERVAGDLLVNDVFWIGWENAAYAGPPERRRLMAARLRDALDPGRWNRDTQRAWHRFADRRGLDASRPPSVVVEGRIGCDGETDGVELLVHRSAPLATILRRFNAYSNNDIERLEANLGPPVDLARRLDARFETHGGIRLSSMSGLGENRLTARLVVRLLRELKDSLARHDLTVESVLPVAGCDPGTLPKLYPGLSRGENAASLTGKTGTLKVTDGGVSVLAGFLATGRGEILFCVAAPHSGRAIANARRSSERFVIDLLDRYGGPRPRSCPPGLHESDVEATLVRGDAADSLGR